MNSKKILFRILFVMLVCSGCEDFMVKTIEVDIADFPPKLAVTAVLDSDGSFVMSLYEGLSLASDITGLRGLEKKGTANLYRDGELIWSLSGTFDLSVRKDNFDPEDGVYRRIEVDGLSAGAGSSFRLEIDIEGYQKVVSTAIMPDDPVCDGAIDTDNPVKKNNIYSASHSWSEYPLYYPVACTLSDNSDAQDYYALQILRFQNSDDPDYWSSENYETGIGTGNRNLIQDNPDMEAGSTLFDGTAYDLYWFEGAMLLSDLTFAGKSAALGLFTASSHYGWMGPDVYDQRPADYDPDVHGPEVIFTDRWELKIGHISAEMFKHYRSLILQEEGLGFFGEPVHTVSNIENGYGCFSLQNSRKIVLSEHTAYYYPEWYRIQ